MATHLEARYKGGLSDADINPATLALPTTATSVSTTYIDLGTAYSGGKNPRLTNDMVRCVVDAQDGTTLGSADTIIVDLECSATSGSGYVKLIDNWITVTGTGSAVAETAKQTVIPSDSLRYIRATATCSDTGSGRDSTYVTLTYRHSS